MANPIVIAYHLIWTAYGWWLPNDPRGSGSTRIASDVIAQLGNLHYGRKRLQPAGIVVREFYARAQSLLKFDALTFDTAARQLIAQAFADAMVTRKYTCYACAIMPDHVHVLIRKHRNQAEDMIEHLKEASRNALIKAGVAPAEHPVWTGGGGWKVFLDHPDEIQRTIPYIDRNPLALGLPLQSWPFVIPYDGWPLHAGHSPQSPYVKALRAAGRYPHDRR